VTEADGFRHPARTPVRRVTRRRFQRANDHVFHLRIRDAALGPWPNATGFAGYHIDVAYFLKERGVSFIGSDGPNDVSPSGLPQGVGLHQLALVALGISIFDNLDFERAAEEARRLNRYEFLFMAAPLRIEKGMGSPLNPLAVF